MRLFIKKKIILLYYIRLDMRKNYWKIDEGLMYVSIVWREWFEVGWYEERSFESIITCAPYGVPIPWDEVKNADARPAWGPGFMHASGTRTLRI